MSWGFACGLFGKAAWVRFGALSPLGDFIGLPSYSSIQRGTGSLTSKSLEPFGFGTMGCIGRLTKNVGLQESQQGGALLFLCRWLQWFPNPATLSPGGAGSLLGKQEGSV